MELEEYTDIFDYIVHKKYKDGTNETKKRMLRRKVKDFIVENGDMYKVVKIDGEVHKLKVISIDKKNLIIKECHIDVANHLGRDKTMAIIKSRYYWKGVFADVNNYIKQCHECQLNNKKAVTFVPEMIPVAVVPKPFQKVGIDLIGPFLNPNNNSEPLSLRGYKYVLNIMDYYTKFPESYCLYSKSAGEVAEKIFDLRCRYGMIQEIISEKGGEFNNKLMQEVCKYFKIKHITTSAYHPQANGMIERFNQTMKGCINKSLKDGDGCNWDNYIQAVCYSYRVTKHDTTKFSPYFMLFNQHPSLLETDFPNQDNQDIELDEQQIQQHLENTIELRKKLSTKVMDNIHRAQVKQKEAYDKRHNIQHQRQHYDIGEKILVKNFRRKRGLGDVNVTKFTGPYIVAEYNGRGNYTIKYIESNKILGNYNQQNFKKYIQSEVESTDTAEDDNLVISDNVTDDENVNAMTIMPEDDNSDDSYPSSAQPNQSQYVNISDDNTSSILSLLSDDDHSMASSTSFLNRNSHESVYNFNTSPLSASTSTSQNLRRTARQRKVKETSIYEYNY